MHFVLLPRRRFWWTGDLDRGATQLSRIRQKGRPPLCLEMISSPAISSETSELLLHPQKKSCFPGQHPAANGKQMCLKCREESLMKAFLPPPGFLPVADSAPGESRARALAAINVPGAITKSPKKSCPDLANALQLRGVPSVEKRS